MSSSKRLQAMATTCAIALGVSAVAHAATLSVADSIDDFEAQRRSSAGSGGNPPAGTYIASENFAASSRIGFQTGFFDTGTTPGGITSVFFFQLPALAPGESVGSASFSVASLAESSTGITPTFSVDLYALGVTDSITKTATDAQNYFYTGGDQGSNTQNPGLGGTRVKLQDNFLTPTDFVAAGGNSSLKNTTAAGTTQLTSYIQNLYANPSANNFTPGTSYLVLRLNPDGGVASGSAQRYNLAFQGTVANGGAGAASERPLITLNTVVPEPTSMALMALGAGAVLVRRRRG